MNLDFGRMDEAGAARLVNQYLGAHFDNIQGKLDNEMFKRLAQGETISPEAALQFLLEKHANHKLLQKLETSLKAGQSASQRTSHLFNGV